MKTLKRGDRGELAKERELLTAHVTVELGASSS